MSEKNTDMKKTSSKHFKVSEKLFKDLPKIGEKKTDTSKMNEKNTDMTKISEKKKITDMSSEKKIITDMSTEELSSYHHSPETELGILILRCSKLVEYGKLKDYLQFLAEEDKQKIDVKDSAGMTALHYAVGCSSLPAVILLLKYGADVNARDMLGFTPLFQATGRYPNTDIALRLLKEGEASVETQTATGATALHGAALQGNTVCVKLLLENGADPRTEDKDGTTPFDLAKDTNIKEILHDAVISWDSKKDTSDCVKLLLENSADPRTEDKDGTTPFDLAKDTNIKEILHDAVISWDSKKDTNDAKCDNCNKAPKDSVLKRCSQCHVTLYCSKECQVKHWKQDAKCDNCNKSAKDSVLKRCSQCHVTLYCSKECQVKHWKQGGHRSKCSGFVIAKPLVMSDGSSPQHVSLYHVMGSHKKNVKMYERKPDEAPKRMEFLRHKKFVVKVQLPLDTQDSMMMVYNADRSCEGFVHLDEKGYKQLASRIRKEGFLGIKAFFWAELLEGDEGKFKVFHGKTAPFQSW